MRFGLLFTALLGLSVTARADTMANPANPYAPIVARNIFSLVPMPTNPPADVKPIDPPSKITPNGIMSLFGQLQVLFKVAVPAKSGQPAKDQSYVLSEGERQDDIEVTKIDESGGMITFNNHGVIQELPLSKATDIQTPTPMGSPGAGPNPMGMRPAWNGHPPNIPPPPPANAAPANLGNNNGANNANAVNAAASSEHLTPEAQVIMMESERARLLDQGDAPEMPPALIPPTELTSQVTAPQGTPNPDPQSN